MALSQAAAMVEKIIGHDDNATTEQDVSNPGRDREKYADPCGEMMLALCWMGKNNAQVRMFSPSRIRAKSDKMSPKWRSPNHELLRTVMSS